ncbi:MAG: hypothetical protein KBD53_06865 [Candidatus Omnitrophica bacterium]|nr:hypothetical protein [Candidatus Omnitrophota bacterium]
MTKPPTKGQYILTELAHHIPFSAFGVMVALLMMGLLTFFVEISGQEAALPHALENLYHVFHPSHIFISAVTSTAMFVKHDRNTFKAVCIGFFGSIILCTLSDAIFPFFGGLMIGGKMNFHVDILQHPGIVLPFAVIGTIAGLAAPKSFERATEYSHSMHIFVSSVASIIYLLAFGMENWVHYLGAIFVVTVFAVMVPCCLSDIVFPLACSHSHCKHKDVMEEEHPH